MGHDVFLCYATEDRATVDDLCAALEDAGVQCWVAPRDIDPGVAYAASIMQAISTTRLFVLVFSHYANASPHVSRELERAVNLQIPIVPLFVEAAEPSDEIGYYISSTQWLVAYPPPLRQHLELIVDIVQRGVTRADETTVVPPPSAPPLDGVAPVIEPEWTTAPAMTQPETENRPRTRRIATLAIAGALVLAVATGVALASSGGDDTGGQPKTTSPARTPAQPARRARRFPSRRQRSFVMTRR